MDACEKHACSGEQEEWTKFRYTHNGTCIIYKHMEKCLGTLMWNGVLYKHEWNEHVKEHACGEISTYLCTNKYKGYKDAYVRIVVTR